MHREVTRTISNKMDFEYAVHMHEFHRLTVFCASTLGKNRLYRDAAVTFAQVMIRRGIDLVYGGGNRGLMGVLADTVKTGGRNVTGILPQSMNTPNVRTKVVESQMIITDGMHKRKEEMYRLGDGFVALPGGIGTVEELMEIYTWLQLGYHHKPVGLLNTNDYYGHLIDFLKHSEREGFLQKECLSVLCIDDDPVRLIDKMEATGTDLPDKLGT